MVSSTESPKATLSVSAKEPLPFTLRLLRFVLSKLVSRQGKRIFFVTSLYCHAFHLDTLRADAIAKLNRVMGLVNDEKGLHFPILFHDMVWSGTPIDEVLAGFTFDQPLTDETLQALSSKVVDLAPPFIDYGRDRMVSDVIDLLRNSNRLSFA